MTPEPMVTGHLRRLLRKAEQLVQVAEQRAARPGATEFDHQKLAASRANADALRAQLKEMEP